MALTSHWELAGEQKALIDGGISSMLWMRSPYARSRVSDGALRFLPCQHSYAAALTSPQHIHVPCCVQLRFKATYVILPKKLEVLAETAADVNEETVSHLTAIHNLVALPTID